MKRGANGDKGGEVMWLQTGAYHLGGLAWLIAAAVILIIAIIALIVAGRALARAGVARRTGSAYSPGAPGTGPDAAKQPEAFRMLDERYAKGEISREEYMQRQVDLQPKS
jgi:putative membrane protein